MTTAYTSLLGFALPVEGELDGTWGTVVNNSITELVEDAIAATATASVTSGDWTLTTTGTGAVNQARCAILVPTGSPGVTRNIIAPSSSKAYIVDNQSNAAVVVKGAATTGATVAAGARSLVAWTGTDFVSIATSTADGVTLVSGTGTVQGLTLSGTVTSTGSLTLGGSLSAVSLTSQVSGTLPVANGGTGQTTYTDGQLLIGNSTGNTLTKATLTAGSGVTITNSAGGITIAATGSGGTITSVGATAPVASSGGTTPTISLNSAYGDTLNPYASKTANFFLAAPNGSAGTPSFRAIAAADIPTLNQNTTGTAANITATTNSTLTTLSSLSLPGSQVSGNISGNAGNVTGTVAIANGGTGQTSAQAAINSLAGAVTSGNYLRGNGTNVVMSAIQAGDVPTLNQNTTGSAGSLSTTNFTVAESGGKLVISYLGTPVLSITSAGVLTALSDVTANGTV